MRHDESSLKSLAVGLDRVNSALSGSKVVRYAQISQGMSHLFDQHVSKISAVFLYSNFPKKEWGYATFFVKENGFLELIEHDFDSSD